MKLFSYSVAFLSMERLRFWGQISAFGGEH